MNIAAVQDFIPPEAIILVMACLVDLAIGDPHWLPHPVRLIGSVVTHGESLLRRILDSPRSERAGGLLLVGLTVGMTYFLTASLDAALRSFSLGTSPLNLAAGAATAAVILLSATTLALRGLVDAGSLVIAALQQGDLFKARADLAMIVGRDTRNLSPDECAKATIETLAENLSDGFVAPLFYLALGGLPLAMAYKAVNTLDSMIGYNNDRYRRFGWAAARLDDAANFIPARFSGVLITVASVFVRNTSASAAWHTMLRDGRRHLSPNSGIPEAAMAGALGVQVGGPSLYDGRLVRKPFIGLGSERNYLEAALLAVRLVRSAALLAMLASFLAVWGLL